MYTGQNAQGSFCHRNSRSLVLGACDFHCLEAAVEYRDMPSGCF